MITFIKVFFFKALSSLSISSILCLNCFLMRSVSFHAIIIIMKCLNEFKTNWSIKYDLPNTSSLALGYSACNKDGDGDQFLNYWKKKKEINFSLKMYLFLAHPVIERDIGTDWSVFSPELQNNKEIYCFTYLNNAV